MWCRKGILYWLLGLLDALDGTFLLNRDGRGYCGVVGGPQTLLLVAAIGFKSGEEARTYPYTP
jgi:hypothetical protein